MDKTSTLETHNKIQKNFLIVIAGPTAIGKTAIAIHLATALHADIISADSRQFYKDLKIGVAAPSEKELEQAQHHFVGHLSVTDYYNVSRFEKDVIQFLENYFKHHEYAIMAGGSGLYIDAVCEGIDEMPEPDHNIRKSLKAKFSKGGLFPLLEQLKQIDPEYYELVDKSNPARVLRALEVFEMTGKPFSTFRSRTPSTRSFEIIKIGLDLPREQLIEKINRRVDHMIEAGLIEEVRFLKPYRNQNALKTVGYQEIFRYLDGEISLEDAIKKIKTNTRRYAKRQLTWFRKDKQITWFPADKPLAITKHLGLVGITFGHETPDTA